MKRFYQRLAENLQYIAPQFYVKRYFKKFHQLTPDNVLSRKVEPELYWIKEYLAKDSVFIDVGANVGHYVYVLSEKLSPENIYAFEPNQLLYKRLKRIFPKVDTFPWALSDENKKAEFKIPIIHGKKIDTRGTLQTQYAEKDEESYVIEHVEMKTLDHWIEEQGISKIDFIKIDVEGNEIYTLKGALQTITKYKPTLMIEMEQRHHTESVSQHVKWIEAMGYQSFYLDRNTLTLHKLEAEMLEGQDATQLKQYQHYINNIIFIP